MFDKRNGVRLGLDSDGVKNQLVRIEELEKHRKAIGWHQVSVEKRSKVLWIGSNQTDLLAGYRLARPSPWKSQVLSRFVQH